MITTYDPKLRDTPFYENLLIEESLASANPFRADLEEARKSGEGKERGLSPCDYYRVREELRNLSYSNNNGCHIKFFNRRNSII